MAMTTDFTGTYDYEREEACIVAESYIEGLREGYYLNADEYHRALIHEREHWLKMRDFSMADFSEEFNRLTLPVCAEVFGKEIYL